MKSIAPHPPNTALKYCQLFFLVFFKILNDFIDKTFRPTAKLYNWTFHLIHDFEILLTDVMFYL